jgi:hypothetical protein
MSRMILSRHSEDGPHPPLSAAPGVARFERSMGGGRHVIPSLVDVGRRSRSEHEADIMKRYGVRKRPVSAVCRRDRTTPCLPALLSPSALTEIHLCSVVKKGVGWQCGGLTPPGAGVGDPPPLRRPPAAGPSCVDSTATSGPRHTARATAVSGTRSINDCVHGAPTASCSNLSRLLLPWRDAMIRARPAAATARSSAPRAWRRTSSAP